MSSDTIRKATSRGIPFILSGPSGAGKTTLYKKAVDFFPDLRHSISYTTRPPREGDRHGEDYWFVDSDEFDRMVLEGEFLEYARVHGRMYGTSKKDLDEMLGEGLDVILEIDVQGADKVREVFRGGVYVFVLPPSVGACRERLTGRGKDSPEEIEGRLNIALQEIKRALDYDYIIVNDDLESAFERLKSVVVAERVRKDRVLKDVREVFEL